MGCSEPLSALVLGSVSRDFIAGGAGPVCGGVVFHAGCALARLGAAVRIITRVRAEHAAALLGPLDAEQIETLALPSHETTSYGLDYRGSVDVHELRAASDPLGPDDVPDDWRHADVIHLGPLHRHDLLPGVAQVLDGFIGLDVQGLVRLPGAEGTRVAPFPELASFLANVDVLKASERELPALVAGESVAQFRGRHGVPELLVTRGEHGATLITAKGEVEIAATPTAGNATVGAGDVFLAAYLLLRVEGREPLAAARQAARITALKVRHGQVPKGIPLDEL